MKGNKLLKKFFKNMDELPVVRLLQLSATFLFLAALFHLITDGYELVERGYIHESLVINLAMIIQAAILKSLYQPVFLLGLAEIIRMKEKQEYKNQEGVR